MNLLTRKKNGTNCASVRWDPANEVTSYLVNCLVLANTHLILKKDVGRQIQIYSACSE